MLRLKRCPQILDFAASQVAADQVNVKGLKLGSNLSSKANSNTISGCRYLSRNVLHFSLGRQ
jgi:hypothetical protein